MLKNVVYNSLVLRFLKDRSGKKNHWCRRDNIEKFKQRDNKLSFYNMFKSKEMRLPDEVSVLETVLKDMFIYLSKHSTQTDKTSFVTLFFSWKLCGKQLWMFIDRSVSQGCVMCWTYSLSGLHLSSTSTACSDPHPKAYNSFVDYSESSLFEFDSNTLDSELHSEL